MKIYLLISANLTYKTNMSDSDTPWPFVTNVMNGFFSAYSNLEGQSKKFTKLSTVLTASILCTKF